MSQTPQPAQQEPIEIGDLPEDGLAGQDSAARAKSLQLATAEAAALESGNLEKMAAHAEHGRQQKFRDHVNLGILILLWVVFAMLTFGILLFSWHLLAPQGWHWMSPEGRDKVGTILAAALLSSALSGYVKKRMD